ncbi:hypothetical protein PybrP1_001167 [[Pythium] brassicae (nom. inval.)]|nr:hypothetical protein PybrP1_001167 [[Pythium] brassicae (nom. inval.)]
MEAKVLFHVLRFLLDASQSPVGALKRVVAKVLKKGAMRAERRRRPSNEDERMAREFEKQAALSLQQRAASEDVVEKPVKKAKDGESDGSDFVLSRPTTRYVGFGGIQAILQEVKELIEDLLTLLEVYAHLGVKPLQGILLRGPPTWDKTMLANAIAGESGVCFLRISAPEIVSSLSGESEQKLHELFDEAVARAPSIVFIDEIDAITRDRAQAYPARARWKMRFDGSFDFRAIAKKTLGYVGADFVPLTWEVAVITVDHIILAMLALAPPSITTEDLVAAVAKELVLPILHMIQYSESFETDFFYSSKAQLPEQLVDSVTSDLDVRGLQ